MDKDFYKDLEKIKTIGSTYMAAVGLAPTAGTRVSRSQDSCSVADGQGRSPSWDSFLCTGLGKLSHHCLGLSRYPILGRPLSPSHQISPFAPRLGMPKATPTAVPPQWSCENDVGLLLQRRLIQ